MVVGIILLSVVVIAVARYERLERIDISNLPPPPDLFPTAPPTPPPPPRQEPIYQLPSPRRSAPM
jgi:hypothetical protein